jgi:hypothetical protein
MAREIIVFGISINVNLSFSLLTFDLNRSLPCFDHNTD